MAAENKEPYCRVDFTRDGNLATFDHVGFAKPEAIGTWSLGLESMIYLPSPGANRAVELALRVLPVRADPCADRGKEFSISANGVEICQQRVIRQTELRLQLPADLIAKAPMIAFRFGHPQPVIPALHGASADRRELAILFQWLELTRLEPVAPVERPVENADFIDVHHPAGLCDRDADTRILVFGPASTAAPAPLLHGERLAPPFLKEHCEYHDPGPAYIYALRNRAVWGNGLLCRADQFFLQPDCFPGYLRACVTPGGHTFPPIWTGALGRPDAECIALPMPVACPLHPNLVYGHFLLEMLPKLYLLSVLREWGARVPVLISHSVPDWVKGFVRLYYSEHDVVWYDHQRQYVTAPALVVPSMLHRDHHMHPAINLAVADLLGRAGVGAAGAGPSLIYVSRSKMAGEPRLLNEADVETLMTMRGFSVIHPQQLSLIEQLRLFAGATVIAGEFSSALHNAMFMRRGTGVIAINFFNGYQSAIARLREQTIAFVPPDDGFFRHWRYTSEMPRKFRVDCQVLGRAVSDMLEAVGHHA